MKWNKLGQIFDPTKITDREWMKEFAQCTSAIIFDSFVRVYFSCRPARDENGECVSYTAFVDLDRKDLSKVIKVAEKPVLELGELGTFDEFGIYPTCTMRASDMIFLYYTGWQRLKSVFTNTSIGLATSNDNGVTFKRAGKGPIMTRTLDEPFQVSGPKVRMFNGVAYMFYISGTEWVKTEEGKSETFYKIKMATSKNGIDWERNGIEIIDSNLENECQAGPDVFFKDGKFHMYFSYRNGLDFRNNDRGYRIGYAYSEDLENWTRDDENAGIELSKEGWDSKDMHYPHVFQLDGEWYMLYNGNEFGKYGFGLAKLEIN